HGLNAPDRSNTIEQIAIEVPDTDEVGVTRLRQGKFEADDSIRFESWISRLQLEETANQQPRANHEHNGKCDLRDYKSAEDPAPGAACGSASADFINQRSQVRIHETQGRSESH